MTPSTDRQWIFVYGRLQRRGPDAIRMKGASFHAEGWVSGRLYDIAGNPGLIPAGGPDRVWGEVFEVTQEQLKALDESENLMTGEAEGGGYRRVRTGVVLDFSHELVEAWVWEWQGAVDEGLRIPSGNWLDYAWPAPPPLFTLTGFALAGAWLVAAFGGIEPLPEPWRGLVGGSLLFGPPMGWLALWLAERRREPWPVRRRLVSSFCVVWTIFVLFALVLVFLMA